MKKMIALLLAAIMLLCGCSAAGSPEGTQGAEKTGGGVGAFFSNIVDNIGGALEKEEKPLLELGKGQKHESLMVLKITVNPEFELYLDMDSCVSRVRCLNEDAVTAFQNMTNNQINVIGLAYADAMELILAGISSAGFLTAETEQIQIETTVHIELPEEDLAALASALAEPVEEYSAENSFTLTVEAPIPEVDTEAALEMPEYNIEKGEPNSEKTFECERSGENGTYTGTMTVYYDENGIRYKRVEEYTDGFYHIEEYESNGGTTYRKYGTASGNSTEHFYDENGNETKRIFYTVGGSCSEYTFHDNGNQASRLVNVSGGGYIEEYWTKSGIPISSISIGADGSRRESTWYENGNMQSEIYNGPDGHTEWHYFEDGTMSRYVNDSNGAYSEEVYYSNGQIAIRIGAGTESRWSESGKLTYEKCDSYLFENGALVYYIDENGVEITDPEQLKIIAIALGFVP